MLEQNLLAEKMDVPVETSPLALPLWKKKKNKKNPPTWKLFLANIQVVFVTDIWIVSSKYKLVTYHSCISFLYLVV